MTGRAWGPSCKNRNAQYNLDLANPPPSNKWMFFSEIPLLKDAMSRCDWNPRRGGWIPKNDHLERNMLNFIWCDHPMIVPHNFRPTSSNDYLCFLQTARNPMWYLMVVGSLVSLLLGWPIVFSKPQKTTPNRPLHTITSTTPAAILCLGSKVSSWGLKGWFQ